MIYSFYTKKGVSEMVLVENEDDNTVDIGKLQKYHYKLLYPNKSVEDAIALVNELEEDDILGMITKPLCIAKT